MTEPTRTPRSVLTVMAHPDDAELWAGGTLARLSREGCNVTISVPQHPETARNTEGASAADLLGATFRSYAEPTVNTLQELLDTIRPEVVITHPLDDIHPDHRHLAHTLNAALPDVVISTGCPQRVYSSDTYNGLTSTGAVAAHTIVDVTETWDVKMRALATHASQPITEHFGPMAETLGRLWGGRIGVTYGENFVPLPVLGRLPASSTL